ncbi:hypothetical protein PC114_g14371 [Phytophthora cactorum]|nr:hypothetical protein PC114_g14371 [Phytophthora cactorum]KAG3156178.1 hypothetical protein C6341_g15161 [Phytophthora cactorum]
MTKMSPIELSQHIPLGRPNLVRQILRSTTKISRDCWSSSITTHRGSSKSHEKTSKHDDSHRLVVPSRA